jgi:hypothetical protein
MKRNSIVHCLLVLTAVSTFFSCKKSSQDNTVISTPVYHVGQPVAPGNISGSVRGTMTSGNTYNVVGDLTINKGDTLLLQSGVTVCVSPGKTIIVKGTLLSLGTSTAPNSFTCCSVPAKINTVAQAENPATDPAYNAGAGWWTGINCDTSCVLLVLKWTHVDYTGAAFPVTEAFVGGTQGGTSFGILFQNDHGDFIMEDSWMYGGIDDAVRIQKGRISLMRNTFEKMGYIGGDVLNAKSGTVGDMAYNFFIGCATGGTKAANKGGDPIECNVNMYNNTYVNCGYRQAQTGRGANCNYEQGAEGLAYNNLIVNCKFGFRIVNNPVADTANCHYSNNYIYADSAALCNQFYPIGYITKPGAYIVPTPVSTGYVYNPNGATAYNASALAGQNNPMFVNFPLPEPGIVHMFDINWATGYNFKLQTGSPALNRGFVGFNPINPTAAHVTNSNLVATVTPPGMDMGCYQANGNGNHH